MRKEKQFIVTRGIECRGWTWCSKIPKLRERERERDIDRERDRERERQRERRQRVRKGMRI